MGRANYFPYVKGILFSMLAGLLWVSIGTIIEILYFEFFTVSLPYMIALFCIFPFFIGWKAKGIIKSFVFTYIFYISSQIVLISRFVSIIELLLLLLILLLIAFFFGGFPGGAFGDYDDFRFAYPFFVKKSEDSLTRSKMKKSGNSLNSKEESSLSPRLFLSHSSKDKALVEKLARELSSESFSVWYDDWEIHVGDSIVEKINEGISTSDFLIVVLSRNSVSSKWVREELNAATIRNIRSKGAFILPVLLEKCEIPPLLSDKKYADFSEDPKSAYRELVEAINHHLKKTKKMKSQTPKSPNSTELIHVIIDQSHKQEKWKFSPTKKAGYKAALDSLSNVANFKVNCKEELSEKTLNEYNVLVFPTPYGTKISNDEFREIADWVFRGHGLLVFGTYLMEYHHYMNLNELARRFGFEFCYNLIMPTSRDSDEYCKRQATAYQERDLWVTDKPIGSLKGHAILRGVNKLSFLSSCTVECFNKSKLTVSISSKCSIMKAIGDKDPDGHLRILQKYVVDKYDNPQFMVAIKYGKGRIVGIGSWKIFLDEFIEDESIDNTI